MTAMPFARVYCNKRNRGCCYTDPASQEPVICERVTPTQDEADSVLHYLMKLYYRILGSKEERAKYIQAHGQWTKRRGV